MKQNRNSDKSASTKMTNSNFDEATVASELVTAEGKDLFTYLLLQY